MATRIELAELLPRYAFLEAMIRGARVLEIGALESTRGVSAVLLHDRGAASVVSLGNEAAVESARRAHGGPGLFFRADPLPALTPASIDLALVHDAAALLAPGAAQAITRVLAPAGHLLVAVRATGPSLGLAARKGAGPSRYAEALAALKPAFPSIEVATQQALVGWVVAPAGVEEPALAVDPGFAGPEAPAFHLFVCGARAMGLRDQTLVPLQASTFLVGRQDAEAKERIEELVTELRHARELVAERESWIEGLRHEVEELHRNGEESTAELQVARVRLVKLEREHEEASDALRRVREQLVSRSRELDGARRAIDSRTEDLRLAEEETESVRRVVQSLGREKTALEERTAELQRRADGLEARATRAESALVELQQAGSAGAAMLAREQARVEAELKALLASTPGEASPFDRTEREELQRRVRDLEDRLEAALSRSAEAEERMRAAERRAEEAESARAESVATARRWQIEAENARRDAAGVAAGVADRDALKGELDAAMARVAEEAGRRAALRAQLAAETERAANAEAGLMQLRQELDQLRRDRDPQEGPGGMARGGPA